MSPCPVCGAPETSFALRAVLYPGCERDIRECLNCGAAFYGPMPGAEDIARCYPRAYYRGFFEQYWRDYFKGRSLALRLAGFRPGGRLLDAGCALGTLLAGARDGSRWSVAGLELSAEAAAMGRELNRVEIAETTLAGAPWPDASFDCVHANNVLEHDPDPVSAMAAAARLLNRGGRLLLTLPNGPADIMINRRLYPRLGALPTKHAGHLVFFSRRSVERLLERSGLRVLSIECFHFQLGLKARGWLPGGAKAQLARAAAGAVPLPAAPGATSGGPKGPSGAAGAVPLPAAPGAGSAAPQSGTLTVEEGRRLIGPKPSWAAYLLRQRWRRLWRSASSELGSDLEVTAEKP